MKLRFLILSLLICFIAAAQPTNYTKINARYRWTAGIFDSSFHLPGYNGTPIGTRVGSWNASGALAADTANGRLYLQQAGSWVRMAKYSEIGGYWTGSGNDIYKNNSGNVGIGITSPAYQLDVGGTSSATQQTIAINSSPVIYKPYQATLYGTHWESLFFGSGGRQETGTGRANVSAGDGALDSITTGLANSAFGNGAMKNMKTGDFNFAGGTNALFSNKYGGENTVAGVNALYYNKGYFMAVLGTSGFLYCDTCETSTGVGAQVGLNIKIANQSNFTGYKAGYATGVNPECHFTNVYGYRALEDFNKVNGVSVFGQNGFGDLITGDFHSGFEAFVGRNWTGGRGSSAFGAYSGTHSLQKLDPVNQTLIGSYTYGTRDNQMILGSIDSNYTVNIYAKDTATIWVNKTTPAITAINSGNVGIGTNAPAKTLHVAGTVRLTSLGTASGDTTTYKPIGISSSGDIIPMTYWPGSGGGGSSEFTTVKVSSDQTTSATSATNITDLVFAVSANTDYMFEAFIEVTTNASTTGYGVGFTFPSGATGASTIIQPIDNTGIGTICNCFSSGVPNPTASINTSGNALARISGIVHVSSTSGNIQFQFHSEAGAGGTATIKAGSFVRYKQL